MKIICQYFKINAGYKEFGHSIPVLEMNDLIFADELPGTCLSIF